MTLRRVLRSLMAALLLALAPVIASAQIGHVVSVQGTTLVERAGQPGRILGPGERLEQKDVINVAQASSAVLEFRDKTRITLRPGTVFRVETYSDAAPQRMAFGLTKGGFRAVTGEVGKKNPSAVSFQADNVVLGIRGTEFDARLCEADCAAEERGRTAQRAVANAAARVIELNGAASVLKDGTAVRTIVPGAVLLEGESIATAADSYAVVVFRDGTRVTLAQDGELAITRFEFDEAAPRKGAARVKLVAGAAHVATGDLAKIGPDAFVFETGAGTIRTAPGSGFSVGSRAGMQRGAALPAAALFKPGIERAGNRELAREDALPRVIRTRSAGFHVAAASAPPQDDVLVVHTWDGTVIIQTATERVEVPKTGTIAIAIIDGRITFLPAPPGNLTGASPPRPDLVNVDLSTFGRDGPPVERGLYVWVRDGAVSLGTGEDTIDLKAGSAARIGGTRITVLDAVPNFMRFDLTPRPGLPSSAQVLRFFRASDGSITRMCK
jgi:hypothetical protein